MARFYKGVGSELERFYIRPLTTLAFMALSHAIRVVLSTRMWLCLTSRTAPSTLP
jgi:hypothetical protein